MNHQHLIVRQLEPDDLQQVASRVGADRRHTRRVTINVKIDGDQTLFNGVRDRLRGYAMFDAER